MHSISVSTTLAFAALAHGASHVVNVGQGGLKFVPDSLTAASGDTVEFHFSEPHHSVVEGSFTNPCEPSDSSAFYSGVITSSGPVFTVTLNSSDPLYFYCSVPSHCQNGMVGAINAPSDQSSADYANAAMNANDSGAPANVQGGVFQSSSSVPPTSSGTAVPPASTSASSASSASASASSPSASGSSTSAPSSASSAASTPASSTSAAPSGSTTPSTGAASSNFQVGLLSVALAVPAVLWANRW